MQHDKVNLLEAMEAHTRLMIDVMDQVVEKAIKSLFKGHDLKQKEFNEELSDLHLEKAGGLVFKGPTGALKIVVTFVGSK